MKQLLLRVNVQTAVLACAVLVWVAALVARFAWGLPVPKSTRIGREYYFTQFGVSVGTAFVIAWFVALVVCCIAAAALVTGGRTVKYKTALLLSLLYVVGAPLALRSGAF